MTADQQREKIKEAIAAYTKRVTVSRETARAALIAGGFYNADGTLTRQYGGEN